MPPSSQHPGSAPASSPLKQFWHIPICPCHLPLILQRDLLHSYLDEHVNFTHLYVNLCVHEHTMSLVSRCVQLQRATVLASYYSFYEELWTYWDTMNTREQQKYETITVYCRLSTSLVLLSESIVRRSLFPYKGFAGHSLSTVPRMIIPWLSTVPRECSLLPLRTWCFPW